MYKLSDHFTLEEFINSATADKYQIDNRPTADNMKNIMNVVDVLEIVRSELKEPIIISSGFRNDRLNQKVGGAKNSDHKYGAAVDIHTKANTAKANKKLFDLIVSLANAGKIKCRQIIDEYNYKWVHISVNHKDNATKNNQILHLK